MSIKFNENEQKVLYFILKKIFSKSNVCISISDTATHFRLDTEVPIDFVGKEMVNLLMDTNTYNSYNKTSCLYAKVKELSKRDLTNIQVCTDLNICIEKMVKDIEALICGDTPNLTITIFRGILASIVTSYPHQGGSILSTLLRRMYWAVCYSIMFKYMVCDGSSKYVFEQPTIKALIFQDYYKASSTL